MTVMGAVEICDAVSFIIELQHRRIKVKRKNALSDVENDTE